MIFELTLQSTYFNQECINRFNYISSGTPAAVTRSFALVSAFGAVWDSVAVPAGYPDNTLFHRIRQTVNTSVSFDFITVKDLYDPVDFYETPFLNPAPGLESGEAVSPTQAYGFRSGRVRSDIRRGMKRFVGVNENALTAGGTFNLTFTGARLVPLAQALGQVLSYNDEGNTITFTPVILGREKYIPDPLRPERVAYRPYPTEAEQLLHYSEANVWDPYTTVRTQNSRQYGRGR